MRSPALAALLSLAVLGGCAPARLDPAAPPEKQVQFVLHGLGKALESNVFEAIAPYFTEDLVIVESSQKPLRGHEGLRFHLKAVRTPIERTRLTAIATYAEGGGVRQTGTLVHVLQMPEGKSTTAGGRFEAFWVKGQDGQWRIRRWELVPMK